MKNQSPRKRMRSSNRDGAIVVLFALLLPLLLIILGFAVDYAYMQKARTEARLIADLASRAATNTLAATAGDVDAAREAARFIARSNAVSGIPITLEDDQIVFGQAEVTSDGSFDIVFGQTPFNSATVLAERSDDTAEGPSRLFFGQLYGNPTFETRQIASSSFSNVDVILVLDRSGSMKREVFGDLPRAEVLRRRCVLPVPTSRWIALVDAVDIFLDELSQTSVQERVGLVTFSGESNPTCTEPVNSSEVSLDVELDHDFTQVSNRLELFNNELWSGRTNIRAGLQTALDHFQSNGNDSVQQVIICLTDGVHNVGEGPNAVAAACAKAGVTVHTITFSESANQLDMERVAQIAGGSHFHAPDSVTLRRVFQELTGSIAILIK